MALDSTPEKIDKQMGLVVQGSTFKGYKILISIVLYSLVWNGLYHPLGETWNSTRLTRHTMVKNDLGHFNREPWTLNLSTWVVKWNTTGWTILISLLNTSHDNRKLLSKFIEIKNLSRLPTYLYLIQRLWRKTGNKSVFNVFLSALLFDGTPGKLNSLWKSGKIQPQVNKTTVAELLRVLTYPKFKLTENEIQYLLYVEILPFCKVVPTKSGPVIISEDSSDDMFLRCCEVSNARALISGDSHLLALKSYGNASILTPSQFLKDFREELSS